jgi:hypothetical protein
MLDEPTIACGRPRNVDARFSEHVAERAREQSFRNGNRQYTILNTPFGKPILLQPYR